MPARLLRSFQFARIKWRFWGRAIQARCLSSASAGFDIGAESNGNRARRQGQGGVKGAGAPEVYISPVTRGVEDFSVEHVAGVVHEVQVDIHGISPEFSAADTAPYVDLLLGVRPDLIRIGHHELSGIGFTLVRPGRLEGDAPFRRDGRAGGQYAGALACA